MAAELLRVARSRNVSRSVLGRPRRRHWAAFFRENVAQRLLRKAEAFEVTIVSPTAEEEKGQRIGPEAPRLCFDPKSHSWATAIVAGATLPSFAIWQSLPLANFYPVYMVAVLITAMRFGLSSSLLIGIKSGMDRM